MELSLKIVNKNYKTTFGNVNLKLHKDLIFLLRISSENVNKCTIAC